MIARREQRKQPRRNRGDPRRIEQSAFGALLHPGQRIGERPPRRRPAPAVVELVVRCMTPCLEIGYIYVQEGRWAQHRLHDDPSPYPRVTDPLWSSPALPSVGLGARSAVLRLY